MIVLKKGIVLCTCNSNDLIYLNFVNGLYVVSCPECGCRTNLEDLR